MGSQRGNKTSHVFGRHVAPFAPLALAFALSQMPASPASGGGDLAEADIPDTVTAVQCEDNIADFHACHENYPTGCSKAGRYDAYLNLLKNGTPSAPTGGITFLDEAAMDNLNTNTPDGLGQGNNHDDFKDELSKLGEGSQFGLIGYLYYYQSTGAESSNCQLTGTDNVDFHIGIGFDSSLARLVQGGTKPDPSLKKQLQQKSVVVEMTPHYRARFHDGVWTLASLKPTLGHKVRVVGQLLVDSEHNKPSDNCALEGTTAQKNHCWRYSIWELHPVTRFEYCDKEDDSCTEDSSDWVALGSPDVGADTTGRRGGAVEAPSDSNLSTERGKTRSPRSSTRSAGPRSDLIGRL